jgi:hypothetical protein
MLRGQSPGLFRISIIYKFVVRKGGFYASGVKRKELAAFSFVPNKALALERPQAPWNALPTYTRLYRGNL